MMRHFDWQELARESKKPYSPFFEKGSAISIGSFDGLHKGHRALLKRLVQIGKEKALPCGVLTFSSPPRYFFSSSQPSCISTLRLKLANLEKLGLDFVILVDFSLNFAKMSGDGFIGLLKEYINLQYLLVGEDFRFGRERASSIGDMHELSDKFSFSFEAFSNLCDVDHRFKISSSLIRKAIYEGDIKDISNILQGGVSVDLLNVKLYCKKGGVFCFLKKDLQQVLPKSGEFSALLYLVNGEKKEIRVLFEEQWGILIVDNNEFDEGTPHFDILKLKEKFKE